MRRLSIALVAVVLLTLTLAPSAFAAGPSAPPLGIIVVETGVPGQPSFFGGESLFTPGPDILVDGVHVNKPAEGSS